MPEVTYESFKAIVHESVAGHIDAVHARVRNGSLTPAAGCVVLYPTTLLFTKTETHYAFELLGVRRQPDPLNVKENKKVTSFNRLVGGFEPTGSTAYMIDTEGSQRTNMLVAFVDQMMTSGSHLFDPDPRLAGVKGIVPTTPLVSFADPPSFMIVNAENIRTLVISRSAFTSGSGAVVRPRYTNLLIGETADTTEAQLRTDLAQALAGYPPRGLHAAPSEQYEDLLLMGSFTTLYLQDVKETTVTEFVQAHERIIKRAFDADSVFYQKTLFWQEGNPDAAEKSIQPDVIIRTRDGRWIILDFKLPLLDKELTAGEHKRRRFTYPLADGIAQLFNYADYFTYQKNCQEALAVLGDCPIEPQLVLVVGSSENFDLAAVEQAKRSHKPVEILDYDTLMQLFLNPAGA